MEVDLSQAQVRWFMIQAGQPTPDQPTVPELADRLRAVRLIQEELDELQDAFLPPDRQHDDVDLVEVADAIADILVTAFSAACLCGIDIAPVLTEVQRTNAKKFKGGYRREDGKWMKPADWQPPNIEAILAAQGWEKSDYQ